MEIQEIFERIMEVAEELEIDESELQEYQLSIDISDDNNGTSGIISDLDKQIEINQSEMIIYLKLRLY